MRHLPREVLAKPGVDFATPYEIATRHAAAAELPIPRPFSWADQERDLTAWLGNPMQRAAHSRLYAMLPYVRAAAAHGADDLLADWRKLSTSDHVYYMATKHAADGDVHEYFSPYDSPHDAFLNFVYALDDLQQRVTRATSGIRQPTRRDKLERTVLPIRDQLGGLQQDRRDLHRHLQQGQDHG
jgi:alpha-amylase